jgi:hypothetical protein
MFCSSREIERLPARSAVLVVLRNPNTCLWAGGALATKQFELGYDANFGI